MDDRTWAVLARAIKVLCEDPSVSGIVVTHGTDTIEETAYFLSQALKPTKPVVLTCAMRPSTAVLSDGPQNLLDACVLASLSTDAPGVWVVALGTVHAADAVHKLHPYRLDAFSSSESGPMGFVEEGKVRWLHSPPQLCRLDSPSNDSKGLSDLFFQTVAEFGLPRVEVVFSHAGATGYAIDAMVAHRQEVAPLRGVVVAGTGNGTIHRRLESAMERAMEAGVRIVRCSRCSGGRMVLSDLQGENEWPPVLNLSPYKARISLALSIAKNDLDTCR